MNGVVEVETIDRPIVWHDGTGAAFMRWRGYTYRECALTTRAMIPVNKNQGVGNAD